MKKKMVVLNYGVGNYRSLKNFFSIFDVDLIVSDDIKIIKQADILVLPGVGNYRAVISFLRQKRLDQVVLQHVSSDKAIFGICIGLHLLGSYSEEAPGVEGLGVFDFKVVGRSAGCHIGWQKVCFDNFIGFESVMRNSFFFNHSYKILETDRECVYTESKEKIPSIVKRNKIFGFQFHPEKSQENGKILINYILKEELGIC